MYCIVFALYCNVLYCTLLYCTVLYCTVLCCAVLCCTVMYCTVLYILYCTVLYCNVLYCTVLYCTVYISKVLVRVLQYVGYIARRMQGRRNSEPTARHFDLFSSLLSCSPYTLYITQFQFTGHSLDLLDNVLHDWLFPHPW